MIQRFEDGAFHSGEVKRRLGLHVRSESEPFADADAAGNQEVGAISGIALGYQLGARRSFDPWGYPRRGSCR